MSEALSSKVFWGYMHLHKKNAKECENLRADSDEGSGYIVTCNLT